MKKILVLLFFIIVSKTTFAQAFVTTWNTGTDNYIIIPGYGTNYNIQWEEIGNPSHNGTKTATNIDTVKFGTAGTYKVSISGGNPAFNRINFNIIYNYNQNSAPEKLLTINDWGNIQWSSFENAFYNCKSLTSVPIKQPNLNNVNDLSYMFYNCVQFNSDISSWNVSNIKLMGGMFRFATKFNTPLNNWNTSRVIYMYSIFEGASSFNQPLNNWITDSVQSMSSMFAGASSFNQPIGNWNTINVRFMSGMFSGASSFNQPIENWNTCTVFMMYNMFKGAKSFNQPLNNWNIGNVGYLAYMFSDAVSFNQPLNNWNTSNVVRMEHMFENAILFNQNINNWNLSKIYNDGLKFLFRKALSFNQPLNNWNPQADLESMFDSAISFNQPIGNWNVNSVGSIKNMFRSARSFNQPLNSWKIRSCDMFGVFSGAVSFNQNIGSWDITNCVNSIGLDDSGIQYYNYDSIITKWKSQNKNNLVVNATNLHYCNSLNQRADAIITKGWQFNGDSYGCILPIHLTSFTATTQQSKVLLQWQTATETNNNYFTVQRSSNNDNWQTIATVKGAGNSSIANNYATTDIEPLQGISYYRIQQTDFDGNISYSEVRKITINNKLQTINIYPNPAKNIVNINSIESGLLNVYNTLGKLVLCQSISKGNNTIVLSSLNNGMYVFNIIGSESQFYKVIKN